MSSAGSRDTAADVQRRIAAYVAAFKRKRAGETAFNRAAALGFAPGRLLPRRRDRRPDRILVVQRVLRIGDTLAARPALAALRERFPDARLTVACRPALAPVHNADALVDDVITVGPGGAGFLKAAREARARRPGRAYVFVYDRWSPWFAWLTGASPSIGYDYAGRGFPLDERRRPPGRANVPTFLYGEGAPAVRAATIWTDLVGGAEPTSYPPFDPGDGARREATAWLETKASRASRPLVVLHPRAANPSYLWDDERWLAVARSLGAGFHAAVALTGSPPERDAVRALAARVGGRAAAAAGELSLLGTCALIANADLVVTLDTAAAHIAATTGVPVVTLDGPGDSTMWAPLGVPHRVVAGDAPCRGCKNARCFQERHYCMEAVAADDVVVAAAALLRERGF